MRLPTREEIELLKTKNEALEARIKELEERLAVLESWFQYSNQKGK